MHPEALRVLDFWYRPETQPFWFKQSDDFDARLAAEFGEILEQARAGECAHWRESIRGRLAEIIVLDQFSRNLYRGTPQAFAQDGMALVLAQEALQRPDYGTLTAAEQHFLLMPLMHSESRRIHEQALPLFAALNRPQALEFEEKHKRIIDRFGRYPHRNAILGRASSAEELAFLQEPDSSF